MLLGLDYFEAISLFSLRNLGKEFSATCYINVIYDGLRLILTISELPYTNFFINRHLIPLHSFKTSEQSSILIDDDMPRSNGSTASKRYIIASISFLSFSAKDKTFKESRLKKGGNRGPSSNVGAI
jgi:hypothetical protein